MARVAFLGLGVMGFPMAGHLAKKGGHDVVVYNRTASKAAAWVAAFGGRSAATPREAAADREVVFSCVGNDDDLRSVVLGPRGALAGMAAGGVLVDHTTASAAVARELADVCVATGVGFLDAPVSGGQAGAEGGTLTVMCGGRESAFAMVEPVIASYARACRLMGPAGSGQLTKMVNQICVAGIVQGLAEGVHFAKRAGLDLDAVLAVISKGAAQSWQMENRGRSMGENRFDFGFAVDWMRKDLGICLDQGRVIGAHLPVTALVDQFYSDVQAMGGARWDTSSLVARLER